MGARRHAKRRDWPANLYQQPSGYYYFRNPQTKKVTGLGRDKPTAFQLARAANAKLELTPKTALLDAMLGIKRLYMTEWLDEYLVLWEAETSPVPGTVRSAKQLITRAKAADFAGMALNEIATKDIAAFLDSIKADSVALNMRSRLHDAFRMAETKGLIETGRNPVTATKPRDYQVKRERLTLEQFMAIYATVTHWAKNGMMLALLTGQRLEDVVEMKFSDYRDGYLFVTQGKTGYKLQQDGTIRLDAVGLTIADVIKQCRDRYISKYMVHHTRKSSTCQPGGSVTPHGLSAAFTRARVDCEIVATQEGGTPPTFHEIRSLAERLYKKQYGAEFAQAIMGHKHAKMTAEYDDLRGGGWNIVSARKAM